MNEEAANKKKTLSFIVAAAVALIALIVGISIYNTPANRVRRQLDLGNKYLEEENYEQAMLAFEEAIAIDERCMEAYAGGLEAYLGAGDMDGAQDCYDRTLAAIGLLDADGIAENIDTIETICLAAESVYGNNLSHALEALEEVFYLTGENEEILNILGACLEHYINILIEAGQYDEVYELIEQYGDIVTNIDFQSILAQMEEQKQQKLAENANNAFMQKVYELMAVQDYQGMYELAISAEAEEFRIGLPEPEYLQQPGYVYFSEENIMQYPAVGVAAHLGRGGEQLIFYYGECYNDGTAQGHGVSFCSQASTGIGYQVFTGEWNGNAPNGQGEIRSFHEQDGSLFLSIKSNFKNGLCDGEVECQYFGPGGGYDLSFVAVNGVPTEDKTEAYKAEMARIKSWDEDTVSLWLGSGTDYIYAYGFANDLVPDAPSNFSAYAYDNGSNPVGVPGFGFAMYIH